MVIGMLDLREEAEELVALAGRAPSLHNAQPWTFRVLRDSVEVMFDDRRMLPVADPVGRQAYLGLGAAVFILRVALEARHHAVRVSLRPATGSGVPPWTFGVTAETGHAAEFAVRDFGRGGREGARDGGLLESRPVVGVLVTGTDHAEDWLRGGQALMRVLLAAAADGYAASYLNQPVELPLFRQQVRAALGLLGWPQLILRIGRPSGPPPALTPRRPPAEILTLG